VTFVGEDAGKVLLYPNKNGGRLGSVGVIVQSKKGMGQFVGDHIFRVKIGL